MIDIRQSVQYANYLKREGWIVERKNEVNYFIRKLPLIGSVLKIQRPEKIDFDTIDKLCRKYRIFQIILEPKGEYQVSSIEAHGFRLSRNPFLPSKTLQIDLTRPIKEIYTNFSKDCRYSIKKAAAAFSYGEPTGEKGFIKEYSTSKEIGRWREAWKNSVNFNRYVPSLEQLLNLKKSFLQNNSLFLASHNISSRIIGGVLFTTLSHGISNYIKSTAYYWYGFTNSEGRTSLSQYALLYQGILWAKKLGCKTFDFEGIYDPRFPNKSWQGFTHFKRSFGGHEVEYPGCYTKLRLPF